MKWKQFLTPVKNMDSSQAREFMEHHREGSYILLDVRQHKEYEREHIPGSILIPLPQLAEQLKELDPHKSTIVY